MPTRVIVVAGYNSVRAGLQAMLAGATDLDLLGDVPVSTEAIERVLPDLRPDVLLLDTVADGTGVDSLGRVLATLTEAESGGRIPGRLGVTAVVAIGDAPDRDLPRLAAAGLPGWGYLCRGEATAAQIVGAVRAAAAGLVALDTDFQNALSHRAVSPATAPGLREGPAGESLTPREIEVLELMAEGLPNKIIAVRLRISLHTAKFHVAQILGKLNAASRTEAVTIGARRGYLTL